MRKQTQWIFYFLLFCPWIYLGYLGFTNQMGANPAEAFNKKLGQLTLYFFLANLYWGCFEALINNRVLKPWFPLRRPLGVATFIYALMHFMSYFAREGDFGVAFKQLTEKTYLLFGLASLCVLFLLAITSNNWSLRKLKFKRWKLLHRLVYVAFILISIHILLIEKRSWLANKYTLYPMALVFVLRVGHLLFKHALSTSWQNRARARAS